MNALKINDDDDDEDDDVKNRRNFPNHKHQMPPMFTHVNIVLWLGKNTEARRRFETDTVYLKEIN